MHVISDAEFGHFQRFIYDAAGISLSPGKKALVCGRLSKRLQARELTTFSEYFRLLKGGDAAEVQLAVDLLTTNETYFFREPRHFDMLRDLAQAHRARTQQPMRVWSAACSSGEEPYSIAMVLADVLGDAGWELMGSDISMRMLERSRLGHYPLERTRHIPNQYLKRYCLRGIGEQAGTLLVERALRSRVDFRQINLNTALPSMAPFDVVFLRNVMIYFNAETKRQVVSRIVSLIRPGGHFMIGHSESLNDISDAVVPVAPSIYRKP